MRRRTVRGKLARHSCAFLLAALAAAPLAAHAQSRQSSPTAPAAPTSTAPLAVMIGKSAVPALERSRQPYRDPEDNALCVAPESVASALGATFTADNRSGKAYFLNSETGASVSVDLRTPPTDSEQRGNFIPLVEVAEALGAKCQFDPATNTLCVRSVLTAVEMLGSQLRIKGTLPLTPRITRMNGGKTIAFDFVGAEVGSLPKNLIGLGPNVVKARSGQFQNDTARIVLELTEEKPFVWLASPQPSTLAVLSSAPGAETVEGAGGPDGEVATGGDPAPPAPGDVAPAVTVTMGPDGKPLPPPTTGKSTKLPTGKPAVPTLLKGVRFVRVSDTQARIIVDAPNAPALRTLLTRARLTLDINGVFGPGTQTTMPEAQHPLLQGVQAINTSATTAQLLIDLARAVNYTVRLDPKGGFTVDLTLPRGAGGRLAGKLIVVDAGHGGHDSGAPGRNGSREKNVTLAIARIVASELRDRGANVIMTRDTDQFVELGERSSIANRANADLFVSVHADSAGSSASGSTVYYHLNDASERTLAQCVAERFRDMGGIRTMGPRSDGAIYTNGFSVLRRTNTLAILCETGYMSNSHDVDLLNQAGMQAKIGRAIASGIQDYIEGNPQAAVVPVPAASVVSLPVAVPDTETSGTQKK